MLTRAFLGAALAAALVAGTSGCGGSEKPVKTSGRVTLDGQPLESAMIEFVSEAKEGRSAHGFSDKNGDFTLTTNKTDDGAAPGNYKVIVTKKQASPGDASGGMEAAEAMKMMQKMGKTEMKQKAKSAAAAREPPKGAVPDKYGKLETTTLRVTIPHNGPVELKLDGK